MPCRVTRASALSTHIKNDCLWITDDILSDAFNRFLRVSHANTHPQHTYGGGRRYGSNVPGPLEARRRLARRRMGLMTNAGAAGPPDLGALFGLNARPPVDWEMSWKWQPPNRTSSEPVSAVSDAGKNNWLTDLLPWAQQSVKEKKTAQNTLSHPKVKSEDLVAKSKLHFEQLLQPIHDLDRINLPDLQPVLDFLQSTQDEPQAENLLVLQKSLEPGGQLIDIDAFRALCGLLLDKAKLRSVSHKQITPFLRLLIYHGFRYNDRKIIAMLAVLFDTISFQSWNMAAIRDLLKAPRAGPGQAGPDTAARFLLAILDTSDRYRHLSRTGKVWQKFYVPLAEVLKPEQLKDHFKNMSETEMVTVICRFWLSHYMQKRPEEAQSLVKGSRKVMLFKLKSKADPTVIWEEFKLLYPQGDVESEAEGAPMEQIWEDFAGGEKEASPTVSHTTSRPPPCQPVVDLLVLLAEHNVRYTALMTDMFSIFEASRTSEEIFDLFKHISLHPALGIPESIAMHRITYFMRPSASAEDLVRAFYVFKNVPSISMLRCMDLPLRLIEKGVGYPSFVFDILARRNGQSDVPLDQRQRRKLTLPPAVIDMAHLVAFAYADQEGSIRTAFARVWETYRFLQDRGAPLTPLMSRALVKAGVLRYLKERQYVPRPQLQYVISLVERLEGAEVASTLDRLAFEVWSKKLDLNDPSLPGGGERGITKMDQGINMATAWRYRRWSRWAIQTSKALRKKQLRQMKKQELEVGAESSLISGTDEGPQESAVDFEPIVTPREVLRDTLEQEAWRTAVDADVEDEGDDVTDNRDFQALRRNRRRRGY